jgi:hypothetical protein
LPAGARLHSVVLLEKVLILAREEIVGALLGLMAEIEGLEPVFPSADESVHDAITRVSPLVVLIDCDHVDCGDELVNSVRGTGARPVLFSPSRQQRELHVFSRRYRIPGFTLPLEPSRFREFLESEP